MPFVCLQTAFWKKGPHKAEAAMFYNNNYLLRRLRLFDIMSGYQVSGIGPSRNIPSLAPHGTLRMVRLKTNQAELQDKLGPPDVSSLNILAGASHCHLLLPLLLHTNLPTRAGANRATVEGTIRTRYSIQIVHLT